jgi:integrase/recombinase XerD
MSVLASGKCLALVRRTWARLSGLRQVTPMNTLLPFQRDAMTPAQLAPVSYLARYSRNTHTLYASQLRRWFAWYEANALDPLTGTQRAHIELFIHHLGQAGLMAPPSSPRCTPCAATSATPTSTNSSCLTQLCMPACRRCTATIPHPSVGPPRAHPLPPVAQTLTVHHGALAFLGINALRASEAAAVRIEDYAERLRGHRVLHLIGKGNKPTTMPITVPVLRVLEACRGDRTEGWLVLRPKSGNPVDHVMPIEWSPASRTPPTSHDTSAHTLSATRHHQRPRRGRPAARCPDPCQARRPTNSRALRPCPRKPDLHGVQVRGPDVPWQLAPFGTPWGPSGLERDGAPCRARQRLLRSVSDG